MNERKRERTSFAVAYAPALGGWRLRLLRGRRRHRGLLDSGGGGGIITAEFRFNGECARERAEDKAGVVRGGGEK